MYLRILASAAIGLAASALPSYANAASSTTEGIRFAACTDTDLPHLRNTQCARIAAPLAYDHDGHAATDGSIQLFLRKFPAAQPAKGTVWLVAGGPGESGASLYPLIDQLRRAFPGYDLIAPDHRGTGYSTRLCPHEESIDSPGGAALEGAEWGSCFESLAANPERTRAFSITNAAYDLDGLIRRYGDRRPTFIYGVSYGTQLVLRTLAIGTTSLKGVVLDSLTPPESDGRWDLSQRSQVVDAAGRELLARCDIDPACTAMMTAPAADRYEALLMSAPSHPPTIDGQAVTDLKPVLGSLLDYPRVRAQIPKLIEQLLKNDATGLEHAIAELQAAEKPFEIYPQSPASIPLTALISASENDLRPQLTSGEVSTEAQDLLFSSAIPGMLTRKSMPLYDKDGHFGATPPHLPPILVLQGTLDPKTPYAGALARVDGLRPHGRVTMITVADAPHFLLWTAPACFEMQVRNFVEHGNSADRACGLQQPLFSSSSKPA
jgi:pimeloyl-ACP methyl ester carboxylesterase